MTKKELKRGKNCQRVRKRDPTISSKTYAQILIFLALSWKKNMSWMNIKPPPCETVEKKPFKIRAAMKESKVVAAAHQMAVARATTKK